MATPSSSALSTYENRIAVATAQNFGILGNGRVHVLDLTSVGGAFAELASFGPVDGVYDLAWSESHESLLVTAVADRSESHELQ